MNRKAGFVVLVLALFSLLIPALSEGKKSQNAFILSNTVAIGVACDFRTDPDQVEFKLKDPVQVRELLRAMTPCPADDVLLSSFPDAYVWFEGNRVFFRGYMHLNERKIAFYNEKRARFYSLNQRGLELLLAVKPDCKK